MKKIDSFTRRNGNWSPEGLIEFIRANNLKSSVLMVNKECVAVLVRNYEESAALGADSDWCISQHSVSWEQYVSKPKSWQVFFFNFSKKAKPFERLIGATFNADGKTVKLQHCFGMDNKPISSYYQNGLDNFNILNLYVLIPNFGIDMRSPRNYLFETIIEENYIREKEEKEEEEKNQMKKFLDSVYFYGWMPTKSSDFYH